MNPLILCLLPPVLILLLIACDMRLRTVRYTLSSDKISAPVRFAVLADLHGCRYGKGQSVLLNAVRREQPDAVLLPGDFSHDGTYPENARITAETLAREYPVFYSAGNHEIVHRHRVRKLKKELAASGVQVLAGRAALLSVRGEKIRICGADDPMFSEAHTLNQMRFARKAALPPHFSLLLSHRPDMTDLYESLRFDLVVSGHAHGGQWRIPLLLNGLYAPHQGLFPRYAGGLYRLNGTNLLVIRGLSRETTPLPRIFNRPEVVIVDIVPEKHV